MDIRRAGVTEQDYKDVEVPEDVKGREQDYRAQLFASYERVQEIGRLRKSGLADTGLVDAATMIKYHLARRCCFISIEALPEYEGEKRREIERIQIDLVATMEFPKRVRVEGSKGRVESNLTLAELELDNVREYEEELRLEAA